MPSIFVSFRTVDSRWLWDHVSQAPTEAFDANEVFMCGKSISAGSDVAAVLRAGNRVIPVQLGDSAVLAARSRFWRVPETHLDHGLRELVGTVSGLVSALVRRNVAEAIAIQTPASATPAGGRGSGVYRHTGPAASSRPGRHQDQRLRLRLLALDPADREPGHLRR